MNRLERAVNLQLEAHPRLKNVLKNIYQFAGGVIPARDQLPGGLITVRRGFFYGFHDLSPWSSDNSKLLAHRCEGIPHRALRPDDRVDVGFFEGSDLVDFVKLEDTSAFNWQEGARLQWVGPSNDIVNNVVEDARLMAERRDTTGRLINRYGVPVCTVSPDGRYGSSYNYARVGRYSLAYSYAGLDLDHGAGAPTRDGLFLLDMCTGNANLVVSLAELANLASMPVMRHAYHYVSHCLFSPDSARLSFMHCWLNKSRRWSRLLAYDLRTLKLHLFPSQEWVSHHCWIDSNRIIAFAAVNGRTRGYHLFEYGSNRSVAVGVDVLISDGHPQVSGDRRWLLTDTYPDGLRRQSILLYDLCNSRRHELLRLRVPQRFNGDLRCDFHPRWNRDFSAICFDSAHPGVRSLCTLDLRSCDRGVS